VWPELVLSPDVVELWVGGKPRATRNRFTGKLRIYFPPLAEHKREAADFERYRRVHNMTLGAGAAGRLALAKKQKDYTTIGWAARTAQNGLIAERLGEAGEQGLSKAIGACAKVWDVVEAPHVGKEWPKNPHLCGERICPIDAYYDGRRTARRAVRVAAIRGARPSSVSMHTLTIKNTSELEDSLDDLRPYFLRYLALLESVFAAEFCEVVVPGLVRGAMKDADGGGVVLETVAGTKDVHLLAGDVILTVDGRPVVGRDPFLEIIDRSVGKRLRVRVRREVMAQSVGDAILAGEIKSSDAVLSVEQLDLDLPVERKLRGGLRALETTFKIAADWHSHVHALLEHDYVSQEYLSVLWWVASAGRGYVMDVRRVYGSVAKGANETIKNPANVTEDFYRDLGREAFKQSTRYITKVLGCADGAKLMELRAAIAGRRLVEFVGGWHDVEDLAKEAVAAAEADLESKIPTECPCGCGKELEVVKRFYGGWSRPRALAAKDKGESLPINTGLPVPSG